MFHPRIRPYDGHDALATVIAGLGLAFYYLVLPALLIWCATRIVGLPLSPTAVLMGWGGLAGLLFLVFAVRGVSVTGEGLVFHRVVAPDHTIAKDDIVEVAPASMVDVVIAWALFRDMTSAHTTRNFLKITYRQHGGLRQVLFPPDDMDGFLLRLRDEGVITRAA